MDPIQKNTFYGLTQSNLIKMEICSFLMKENIKLLSFLKLENSSKVGELKVTKKDNLIVLLEYVSLPMEI